MSTTYHYIPATEVRPGDILPDESRFHVSGVFTHPHQTVMIRFEGTEFTAWRYWGGPDFGWPHVRVERSEA